MKSQFDFSYLEIERETCKTRDFFISHFHGNWRKYSLIYEALETRFLYAKEILEKLVHRENHASPYFNLWRVSRCLIVLAKLGWIDESYVPTNRKNVVNRIYRRKNQ